MSAGTVSVQSARLAQAGISRQILKEGSSVLVRVIGNKGNGKYEGSVAGVRVQLSSAKPLKAGQTFSATISVKDGKIIVTPKVESGNSLTEMPVILSRTDEASIAAFLAGSGLPSDSLSVSILQQLKQMGLKIDAQLMSRIHNLALRFKGKEKSASEILMILADKGLTANDDEILELLELLSGDKDFSDLENRNESDNHRNKKEKLINRINQREGKWYLLPFELLRYDFSEGNYLDSEKKVLGKGVIRLLFENEERLRLMNINSEYNDKIYIFSLLFEGKVCEEVRFNISDKNGNIFNFENTAKDLMNRFMMAGLKVPEFKYCAASDIEGSACGCEEFYSFGGEL